MFFGYPIAATAENWLHECLVEMVTAVHVKIEAGQKGPLKWPDCIPVARRAELRPRHGLKKHLNAYRLAVQKLSAQDRKKVLGCLTEQNQIQDLVSNKSRCDALADLPEAIQVSVDTLFSFAFGLLTDLGIRDRHYKTIFETVEHKVCPFCACEYFDAPVIPSGSNAQKARQIRESLDHYLPRSHYPFAAANLHNLPPIGRKCNQIKRDQDILRMSAAVSRRSFYPYANRIISISLGKSVPFKGADGKLPKWQIDLKPDSPECKTWDAVFNLRVRLQQDVLDPSFMRWLKDFAGWFRLESPAVQATDSELVAALKRYADNEAVKGFNGRDFLRAHVFRMLHQRCSKKDTRLLKFVRDVITMAAPVPKP